MRLRFLIATCIYLTLLLFPDNRFFAQTGGWMDFRDPAHYGLRGGAPWELKVVSYQGQKYLYSANIGGALMRCAIPTAGSSVDPAWTHFLDWVFGCGIDAYSNAHGCLIGYGTLAFHINAAEGFFWSNDNGATWSQRNVPDYGGWRQPSNPPDRYWVQDVAILQDPSANPATATSQNYWILVYTIPLNNVNQGIYHYYDGPQGLRYYYETLGDTTSSVAWKIIAERDIGNSTNVVLYACGDDQNMGGYGLWRGLLSNGAYQWESIPESQGINVEDFYQDADDPAYLFMSVKYAEDAGRGDLYFSGNRGLNPWIKLDSYWSAIGSQPNGHARDLVADFAPLDSSLNVWAAVGTDSYDLKGPWHYSPSTQSWQQTADGLWNRWPNREILVNDPDQFDRLFWGSWGGGVFEYEPLQGWESWDNDYNAEFNRSLIVDRAADPDVVYVTNQGGGIWKGIAATQPPYSFTSDGVWLRGATDNQLYQHLGICPWDASRLYASTWDPSKPLFSVDKSDLSTSEVPGLGSDVLTGYTAFEINCFKADIAQQRLYLGVSCWGSSQSQNNLIQDVQLIYLDANGFHELSAPFPYPQNDVTISDVGFGANGNLWVVTGEDIWQPPGATGSLYTYNFSASSWTDIYAVGKPLNFFHSRAVEVIPRAAGDYVFCTSHSNVIEQVPNAGGIFLYNAESGQTINLALQMPAGLTNFRDAGFIPLLLLPFGETLIIATMGVKVISGGHHAKLFYTPWPNVSWQAVDSPIFEGKKYLLSFQVLDYSEDHQHLLTAGGKIMEYVFTGAASNLPGTWSWVSLQVHPTDNALAAVTQSIEEHLVCVEDGLGRFYFPDSLDQIGFWQDLAAYKIKTSASAQLSVEGIPLDAQTPITLASPTLDQPFNFIAYLPMDSMSCDYAFAALDCLIIAKDDQGNFWGPGLGSAPFALQPGKGYAVAVSAEQNLIYPEPPSGIAGSATPRLTTALQRFQPSAPTGDFYPLLIDEIRVGGAALGVGDEIGLFTPGGLCLGATAFSGQYPLTLAAWEDDPTTIQLDGFQLGDTPIFRYYNALAGVEVACQWEASELGGAVSTLGAGLYGRYLLRADLTLPDNFALDQNFPNPFNPNTKISYRLPHECQVWLEVYDLLGRRVKTLFSGRQTAGFKTVWWEGRNDLGAEVAAGIYFLRLRVQTMQEIEGEKVGYIKSRKMMLLR